jgi:diguanylate cyclase (GGDEF)-like protein/PAS domain S-box-containing protein
MTRSRFRLSLTWQFAITVFAILAFIGAMLVWVLQRTIVEGSMQTAQVEARDTVARTIGPIFTAEDLAAAPAGDRLAELDRFVRERVLSSHTVGVTIWNANGDVVYSSGSGGTEGILDNAGARAAALAGSSETMLAEVAVPVPAGKDQRGDSTALAVAVYTPLHLAGSADPAGAVALARLDTAGDDQVAGVRRDILMVLGSGLVIIYLALLAVMRRGDVTLAQQQDELTRAAVVMETIPDLVAITSPRGRLISVNPAGRRLFGLEDEEDLSRMRLGDCCPPMARDLLDREGFPAAVHAGTWHGEIETVSSEGREVPVAVTIRAHKNNKGDITYMSVVARDLTEVRGFEARLLHLASHDALTGLFNRRRFDEEIQRELAQARRYGTKGALLYVDLDNFKLVNDRLGHRVGDALLVRMATVLRKQLRETDTIARLSGDEFAALLPQVDAAGAQLVATRILDVTRRDTMVIGGQPVRTTASIGIALFPEHGTTSEDLLVHADRAMYQAKSGGRDALKLYKTEANADADLSSERNWEHKIREALGTDKFTLVAQPILHLGTNKVSQYELLLRLAGDDGEIITPIHFLGVAERSGLIHAIDRWVVREAIRLIAEQRRAGRDLFVEVNLSGMAFTDRELLPLIQYELLRTRINPACLTLEITETAAIADMEQAQTFIGTLRNWGCRFAIDDFGVGFSSFSYLKHLAADYVKLDGSFIRNLPRDAADQHLVKAMVEVARGLGKQTIAEFVGDQETVDLLRGFGVDYAQGYHVGKPAPLEELLPRARRSSDRAA